MFETNLFCSKRVVQNENFKKLLWWTESECTPLSHVTSTENMICAAFDRNLPRWLLTPSLFIQFESAQRNRDSNCWLRYSSYFSKARNETVMELGCAGGITTRVLVRLFARVICVEKRPQFTRHLIPDYPNLIKFNFDLYQENWAYHILWLSVRQIDRCRC